MRLLDTRNFKLCSFLVETPPYAILSHRWLEEEVTFKEISDPGKRASLKGWVKILNCCRVAAEDGWDYVWIDTCCIDKSDNSELSEAINSMFGWYEAAEVCYAFLDDVPSRKSSMGQPWPWCWHLRSSRWFTRGWTLQELLAPGCLLFLSSDWTVIASGELLAEEVAMITGIKENQLLDFRSCSAATKLSWAAKRETTRLEDRAYCLFGLLGINLPLLYGEGNKAFERLQMELVRQSADETVVLWGKRHIYERNRQGLGSRPGRLFATSPADYASNNDLMVWLFDADRGGFGVANGSLSFSGRLFELDQCDEKHIFAIELNCTWLSPLSRRKSPMVMLLRNEPAGSALFERASIDLRTRDEAAAFVSSSWRDLGKRDIFIVSPRKEPETGRGLAVGGAHLAIHVKLIPPSYPVGGVPCILSVLKTSTYVLTPTYAGSSQSKKWMKAERTRESWAFEDCHILVLGGKEALIALGRALLWEVELHVNQLIDSQSGNPSHHRTVRAVIVIETTRHRPSFGIWKTEDGEDHSAISERLLTTDDRTRLHPQVLPLGGKAFLCITGRPRKMRADVERDVRNNATRVAEAELGHSWAAVAMRNLRIAESREFELWIELRDDEWSDRYVSGEEFFRKMAAS